MTEPLALVATVMVSPLNTVILPRTVGRTMPPGGRPCVPAPKFPDVVVVGTSTPPAPVATPMPSTVARTPPATSARSGAGPSPSPSPGAVEGARSRCGRRVSALSCLSCPLRSCSACHPAICRTSSVHVRCVRLPCGAAEDTGQNRRVRLRHPGTRVNRRAAEGGPHGTHCAGAGLGDRLRRLSTRLRRATPSRLGRRRRVPSRTPPGASSSLAAHHATTDVTAIAHDTRTSARARWPSSLATRTRMRGDLTGPTSSTASRRSPADPPLHTWTRRSCCRGSRTRGSTSTWR